MNENFTSKDIQNYQFTMNKEDSDYKNLILRLKEISEIITLLEQTKSR